MKTKLNTPNIRWVGNTPAATPPKKKIKPPATQKDSKQTRKKTKRTKTVTRKDM